MAVYNELGVMYHRKSDISVSGVTEEKADLLSTPTGVYTVVFTSSDCRVIRKIIIGE